MHFPGFPVVLLKKHFPPQYKNSPDPDNLWCNTHVKLLTRQIINNDLQFDPYRTMAVAINKV
jgi:hypothetical protein